MVYLADGHLYAMKADGSDSTKISFGTKRDFEDVAVSFGRRYIAVTERIQNRDGQRTGRYKIWLYDLVNGKERQLAPGFVSAGDGGVSWSSDGYLYFSGRRIGSKVQSNKFSQRNTNDLYRVHPHGTQLKRLTNTASVSETEVSVSDDGQWITFVAIRVQDSQKITEIWMSRSDGSKKARVYEGGIYGKMSVHNPHFSPDNKFIAFNQINPNFRNFMMDPTVNTAMDIFKIGLGSKAKERVTMPGPASIVQDWHKDDILLVEFNDQIKPAYHGISVVRADMTEYNRIKPGARSVQWIPASSKQKRRIK